MSGRLRRKFHLLADSVGQTPRERVEARRVLAAARVSFEKSRAFACELLLRSRAAVKERPGAFGPATEALFDLVADSDLLPVLLPRGRLPREFAARSLAEARVRLDALGAEREALAAAARVLRAGRRQDAPRIDRRMLARLARFAARYPGEPEEGLPPGVLALPGTPLLIEGTGRLHERTMIRGSRIILGRRLIPGRSRLRVATAERARSAEPRTAGAFLSRSAGRERVVEHGAHEDRAVPSYLPMRHKSEEDAALGKDHPRMATTPSAPRPVP